MVHPQNWGGNEDLKVPVGGGITPSGGTLQPQKKGLARSWQGGTQLDGTTPFPPPIGSFPMQRPGRLCAPAGPGCWTLYLPQSGPAGRGGQMPGLTLFGAAAVPVFCSPWFKQGLRGFGGWRAFVGTLNFNNVSLTPFRECQICYNSENKI